MMEGWKTKLGAVLIALAGVITAVSGVLPPELAPYLPWFTFAEALFATIGAAFMGIGIAHKVEKASKAVCAKCGK